jgi:hypothetical protein
MLSMIEKLGLMSFEPQMPTSLPVEGMENFLLGVMGICLPLAL